MLTSSEISRFKQDISTKPQIVSRTSLAKPLVDPTSFKMLYILSNSAYVCPSNFSDILDLSLSTVSHQLAKLRAAGIVTTVRVGQMICYSLSDSPEALLLKKLLTLMAN
jgi:DNA-binding transcriptional ArsR family regulator